MYDRGNGATAGQVLDLTHHWETGILFRLGFIFPVAELTRKEKRRTKRANNIIKHFGANFWEQLSMFTREILVKVQNFFQLVQTQLIQSQHELWHTFGLRMQVSYWFNKGHLIDPISK